MLQRIYGTAWESKPRWRSTCTGWRRPRSATTAGWGRARPVLVPDRDRRRPAVWHPKGGLVRKLMEDYSRASATRTAATSSSTRPTSPGRLFETSGHLDWFADGMYPPDGHGQRGDTT